VAYPEFPVFRLLDRINGSVKCCFGMISIYDISQKKSPFHKCRKQTVVKTALVDFPIKDLLSNLLYNVRE